MKFTTVCVVGGSGFVGRHLCHQLAARGYRVRVPTRDRERARELLALPTVDVVAADVHREQTLEDMFHEVEAVINLVGVLHEGSGNRGFGAAHAGLARKIVGGFSRLFV